jgi:hypothetical protein
MLLVLKNKPRTTDIPPQSFLKLYLDIESCQLAQADLAIGIPLSQLPD